MCGIHPIDPIEGKPCLTLEMKLILSIEGLAKHVLAERMRRLKNDIAELVKSPAIILKAVVKTDNILS